MLAPVHESRAFIVFTLWMHATEIPRPQRWIRAHCLLFVCGQILSLPWHHIHAEYSQETLPNIKLKPKFNDSSVSLTHTHGKVSVVLKLNIYLDFKSTVASAGMAWECIATFHLYIKREIKSLHSTDSLVEYTCVKRQRSLAASASLQPLADRQSRMAWLLDWSPFVCGTDAEQTLHSRCVDVEASGRRYTVIKNSVIACGLFPLLSLFLLSLFSPSARSIPPLLPFFSVIELLRSAYLVYMYFPAWGIEAAFTLKICKLYFTRAVSEALYSSTIHFVHCLSNGHLLSSVFLLLVNFLDSPQEEKKKNYSLVANRQLTWAPS